MEDKIFGEQLAKNPAEELINDYYDIENLIAEYSDLWKGQSLENYLQEYMIFYSVSKFFPSENTKD